MNTLSKEITWNNKQLIIETGELARQADGAVVVKSGGSIVLVTAVASHESQLGSIDYVGLSVNYQEKAYAIGRIPGGFTKREGRSERDVLYSRLIDRALRPLFDEHYLGEIQITATVLSHDPAALGPDVMSIIGASLAVQLAGIPFSGPVAANRIVEKGRFKGKNHLDLVIGGTRDYVTMVEASCDEIPEDVMQQLLVDSHRELTPIFDLMEDFIAEYGAQVNTATAAKLGEIRQITEQLAATIEDSELLSELEAAIFGPHSKKEYSHQIVTTHGRISADLAQRFPEVNPNIVKLAIKKVQRQIIRDEILDSGQRLDGRGPTDIRPISCHTGYLSATHGSALFTRGETQVLAAATLGGSQDEQIKESLDGVQFDNFILHYNFPPFATNEIGAARGPGRREIGHGNLAYNALRAMVPLKEQFSHTIRVVAEVTESNGSSSMATVCAASLALFNAGVPLRNLVGGIAMGLVKDGDDVYILSDITGSEDSIGDMDFKVAGTEKGITGLQMDIKSAINYDILTAAIAQARGGLDHILGIMYKDKDSVVRSGSGSMASSPKIATLSIDESHIRKVIGTGGRVIKDICEKSGAKIEISDNGKVTIMGQSQEAIDIATDYINDLVRGPQIGSLHDGAVTKILEFGMFVKFGRNHEGMVHISEISEGKVDRIEGLFKVDDKVRIRVLDVEKNGRIRLSMKNGGGDGGSSGGGGTDYGTGSGSATGGKNDRGDGSSDRRRYDGGRAAGSGSAGSATGRNSRKAAGNQWDSSADAAAGPGGGESGRAVRAAAAGSGSAGTAGSNSRSGNVKAAAGGGRGRDRDAGSTSGGGGSGDAIIGGKNSRDGRGDSRAGSSGSVGGNSGSGGFSGRKRSLPQRHVAPSQNSAPAVATVANNDRRREDKAAQGEMKAGEGSRRGRGDAGSGGSDTPRSGRDGMNGRNGGSSSAVESNSSGGVVGGSGSGGRGSIADSGARDGGNPASSDGGAGRRLRFF